MDPEAEWLAESTPRKYGFQMEQQQCVHGTQYPLNSRRLTAENLRIIAEMLGLPTTGSIETTRQCIEGKLLGDGHTPANVVVTINESENQKEITLADLDGEFLRSQPVVAVQVPTNEEEEQLQTWSMPPQVQLRPEYLQQELQQSQQREAEQLQELRALREELSKGVAIKTVIAQEVEELKRKLATEKERFRHTWQLHCENLRELDDIIMEKDEEIACLRRQLSSRPERSHHRAGETGTGAIGRISADVAISSESGPRNIDLSRRGGEEDGTQVHHPPSSGEELTTTIRSRRGKAPPVDSFTGESAELRLDEWLPGLARAAEWNGWTPADQLLQLAGHLRGKALQEWNLIDPAERSTYTAAVEALRSRLDPGSKTVAAQEFRHTVQRREENVTNFIRRLEKSFQVAYGRDNLAAETRNALLYGQLYEGLKYELMQGPAVSGSQTYKELCTAAKGEEWRLEALRQRQLYGKSGTTSTERPPKSTNNRPPPKQQGTTSERTTETRKCYKCGQIGHLARSCRAPKSESKGVHSGQQPPIAKQVKTKSSEPPSDEFNPLDILFSSSDDDDGPLSE